MSKPTTLSEQDLARYERYKAERLEKGMAFQQAQAAFAEAEATFQGHVRVLESEYDFSFLTDDIGEGGQVAKNALDEATRQNRLRARQRQASRMQ